jgi:hypothetical protein
MEASFQRNLASSWFIGNLPGEGEERGGGWGGGAAPPPPHPPTSNPCHGKTERAKFIQGWEIIDDDYD